MHYARWQHTGDPEVRHVGNFKGDNAGYLAIHVRLRNLYGNPNTHDCVVCGKTSASYAYNNSGISEKTDVVSGLTVRYSVDLTQYSPMCNSCHRKVDYAFSKPPTKYLDFICPTCKKTFTISETQYNYNQIKRGNKGPFCSRHCIGVMYH